MKNSAQKIRTSHVGRLPVPPGFEEAAFRLPRGEVNDEEMAARVVPVVAEVVKRQVEIGLDCFGDGEYWSALDIKWFDQQMSGLSTRPLKTGEVGSMRESTRERDVFRTLYADMDRVGTIACIPGERPRPSARERIIVSGPIKTRGTAATQRQLDCFKAAIARAGVALDEAFVPALAPGWLDHFIYNEHYRTDEEFVYALADAMRDKYRAIVDAGFILQIDDPGIATSWDMIEAGAEPSRLSEIRDLADRGAEPCPRRHPTGESALSLVLGQLARRAYQRYTSRTHYRHRSQGEGANLLLRGRERAAPARNGCLERDEARTRYNPDAGRDQSCHEPRGASRTHRATPRRLGSTSSGGRMWWPAPIAAWEDGCMPKLAGRSSLRWPKGRLSRRKPCGIDSEPFL